MKILPHNYSGIGQVAFLLIAFIFLPNSAHAQSANQSFPTPVTTNEISGTIRARDVGDSRLTTYYYTFDGEQGDVFINVLTRNFTGDIDIFAVSGLRPMTKIVIYSDLSETETGRVIYLRKPERLLLRIEGRTPGDDAATFQIKFAGSFVASKAEPATEPELPKVKAGENTSGIRVNSVGTIIEVIPKPKPPKETIAIANVRKEPETTAETSPNAPKETEKPVEPSPEKKAEDEKTPEEASAKNETVEAETITTPRLIVTEGVVAEKPVEKTVTARRNTRRPRIKKPTKPPTEPVETATETPAAEVKPKPAARTRRTRTPKIETVDPLANVNLVILFKDEKRIERPMSEVLKFSVERGILTVISKNGTIGRYPMIEVAKVTIE